MSTAIQAGPLLAFIERIESGEDDKKAAADHVKDVYAEAKGAGYDAKILRKIVAARKQSADERREEEEVLTLYMQAIGMQV